MEFGNMANDEGLFIFVPWMDVVLESALGHSDLYTKLLHAVATLDRGVPHLI
jgi:hypothetical protein